MAAYHDDLVERLARKFSLTEHQNACLQELAVHPVVLSLIQDSNFNVDDLLILDNDNNVVTVLPVTLFSEFMQGDRSDAFEELKILSTSSPDQWLKYLEVLSTIESIVALPRRKLKLKRQLAIEAIPDIMSFSLAQENVILARSGMAKYILNQATKLLAQYMNMLPSVIEQSAENYFRALYSDEGKEIKDIHFRKKRSGIQLGTVADITYYDKGEPDKANTVTYYIKTHQHGSTSQASSVKPVDPKELYVYKLLEKMGRGPKTFFFYNALSEGGFYIASQDIAFKNEVESEVTYRPFETLLGDFQVGDDAWNNDDVRRGLIALDMLARILVLTDTTTNPGNFGEVVIHTVPPQKNWVFLDFRTPEHADFYANPNIFGGFEAGNGMFNYDYADFLRDIFKNPEKQVQKYHYAHAVANEIETLLADAAEAAFEEVGQYVTVNHDALKLDAESAIEDLGQYHEAILQNAAALTAGINEKYDSLVSSNLTMQ